MKSLILSLILLVSCLYSISQSDTISPGFNNIKYDTTSENAFFKGIEEYAHTKLNYSFSEGYSTNARYSFDIIIFDSLLILFFDSPKNSDWNLVKYQRQAIIDDSVIVKLFSIIESTGIKQKKKGFPIPPDSSYTENQLYIESENFKLAGGTVYINRKSDANKKLYSIRIKKERDLSSSFGGDYEMVFKEIEKLFPQLQSLKNDMQIINPTTR